MISQSLDDLTSVGKILLEKLLTIEGIQFIKFNINSVILRKNPVFEWEKNQILYTVQDAVSFLAISRDKVVVSKNGMII